MHTNFPQQTFLTRNARSLWQLPADEGGLVGVGGNDSGEEWGFSLASLLLYSHYAVITILGTL